MHARMPSRLHSVWDGANVKYREYEEKDLRRGAPNLHIEDFVDMEKAQDPGHFEPNGKLKAMDRDDVQAEVGATPPRRKAFSRPSFIQKLDQRMHPRNARCQNLIWSRAVRCMYIRRASDRDAGEKSREQASQRFER
jgi:hypothetical protein